MKVGHTCIVQQRDHGIMSFGLQKKQESNVASKVEKVAWTSLRVATEAAPMEARMSAQLGSVGSQWSAVPKRTEKAGVAAIVEA